MSKFFKSLKEDYILLGSTLLQGSLLLREHGFQEGRLPKILLEILINK
jgi:hypothetical protein